MRLRRAAVVCLLLAAAALNAAAAPSSTDASSACAWRLRISDARAGTDFGHWPLCGERPEFALGFLHSVSLTRVLDLYRVEQGRIVQTAELFEEHGAGLPSTRSEIGGRGWHHEQGRFRLDLERPIGRLVVRVGRDYGNELKLPTATVDLTQWGDRALEITVEPNMVH